MNLGEIFTEAEIKAAMELYGDCKPGEFNKRVVAEIVEPIMARINQVTGQENDPRYFGYLLEHVITRGLRR